MKMPHDILELVAHLRDFLADVERGRRPDYNTLERASMKYAMLKYKLRMLPTHETVVIGREEPDLLPPLDPGNE